MGRQHHHNRDLTDGVLISDRITRAEMTIQHHKEIVGRDVGDLKKRVGVLEERTSSRKSHSNSDKHMAVLKIIIALTLPILVYMITGSAQLSALAVRVLAGI